MDAINKSMDQHHQLDLRGVACPTNFVKIRLCLEKMLPGQVLVALLDAGEPIDNVSKSVQAEGHVVEESTGTSDGYYRVAIRRA